MECDTVMTTRTDPSILTNILHCLPHSNQDNDEVRIPLGLPIVLYNYRQDKDSPAVSCQWFSVVQGVFKSTSKENSPGYSR